jgi:hypothetical protein
MGSEVGHDPFYHAVISCACVKGEHTYSLQQQTKKNVALSPQANYTDWATATYRRNLVPTFLDRWVSRG